MKPPMTTPEQKGVGVDVASLRALLEKATPVESGITVQELRARLYSFLTLDAANALTAAWVALPALLSLAERNEALEAEVERLENEAQRAFEEASDKDASADSWYAEHRISEARAIDAESKVEALEAENADALKTIDRLLKAQERHWNEDAEMAAARDVIQRERARAQTAEANLALAVEGLEFYRDNWFCKASTGTNVGYPNDELKADQGRRAANLLTQLAQPQEAGKP